MLKRRLIYYVAILCFLLGGNLQAGDVVKIGMNYPQTGPYKYIGIDQERGAQLALNEINKAGGILGRPVEIYHRNSKSNPDITARNVLDLIEQKGVDMIFGGVSSGVALKASEICQEKGVLFMAPITCANEVTGKNGHRHTFRTCYSARMGAKALGKYLRKNYPADKNKYFFIIADYSWGRSAEASIREFSGAVNPDLHRVSYTKFPGVTEQSFVNKMRLAKVRGANVLVLCHFGDELTMALRIATELGLKKDMQIVVPILELSMCEGAGPEVMEGIVGTADFNWQVPFYGNNKKGQAFVNTFAENYGRYPCWGAAKAYTILWEYKNAVERAQSFNSPEVIRALEGHLFTQLKDEEKWRDFDHQNMQTVFLVKCKPSAEVLKDKYQMDYFEIIDSLPGSSAVVSHDQWSEIRAKANLPPALEKLPGEL